MKTELTICGTRGSFPLFGEKYEIYGQATSCYVIKDGDYAIVFDCGTGLVNAAQIIQDCKNVDIVVTHIHYDHIMGLYMLDNIIPDGNVTFYGNFDAWASVTQKSRYGAHSFWPSNITKYKQVSVKEGENYELSNGFSIMFKKANHGNGAMMVAVSRGEKRFCFTGDNECTEENIADFAAWIRNCDILLFDGSFSPEDYDSHRGWGHSSWDMGCRLARNWNVKRILITHYAMSQTDEILAQDEARAKEIFGGVEFAREGNIYEF